MLPAGITTAALLKAQLDRGSDYFELLTPFVERALETHQGVIVAPEALRATVEIQSGLRIALRTLVSLLDRLSRRSGSAIAKEGVSFVRTGLSLTPKDCAAALSSQFMGLGRSFRAFAGARVRGLNDDSDALLLIVGFLEANSVTLVLDGVAPEARTGRKEDIILAQFVGECLATDGGDGKALLALLQGLILARAVTLEDLASVERKLTDLRVYFDTSFVFAAAGLYGATDLEAARDAIRVLRELGAVPAVFDATIDEARRVLSVYEDKLDTAQGRADLYQTPLTAHFLSRNARGTDARQASDLLELSLRSEGMIVHATPPRRPEYVADEAGLVAALRDVRGEGHEAREKHDLDCLAAILTLRRGSPASRLEDARAIFAASGMVVRTTQRWWRAGEEQGLAPIIDLAALLNYCWLKRPSVARQLHRFELAALCTSTLAPSDDAWVAFKSELRRMISDGRVTSSEAAVILIDSFSQKLLVEAEATDSITPESAAQLVERARTELRKEIAAAQAETLRERKARQAELVHARHERDGALSVQARGFEARLEALDRTLETERASRQALEDSVSGLARLLSKFVAVPVAAILVAATVAVVVFPFVDASQLSSRAQLALKVATVALGVAGGVFGVTALSLGRKVQLSLEQRLRRSLMRGSSTLTAGKNSSTLP